MFDWIFWLNFCHSKLPNTRKVASHPRFLKLAIPNRQRARRQGGCWAFGQGNGGTWSNSLLAEWLKEIPEMKPSRLPNETFKALDVQQQVVGQVTGELLALIHKPVLMMLISKCDTRFWPVAWCIDVKAQVVASKSLPKEQRCQLTNSLPEWVQKGKIPDVASMEGIRNICRRCMCREPRRCMCRSCRQVTAPLRSPVRPSSASGPARSPATTVARFFENRKVKHFFFEKKMENVFWEFVDVSFHTWL